MWPYSPGTPWWVGAVIGLVVFIQARHRRRRAGVSSEHVINAIRARLKAHEWQPGDALPTVTALRLEYGVSDTTVGEALATLRAEGLIVVRDGGSFVAEP